MKKHLLILCGGRSAEHEVSLVSASNVVKTVDQNLFQVHVVAIDHQGYWHLLDRVELLFEAAQRRALPFRKEQSNVTLIRHEGKVVLYEFAKQAARTEIDVVFPILHGPFGEDGSIQGWLRGLQVPFVGSSVLGSSVSMDKDVMKRLLRDAGLPISKFQVVYGSPSEAPTYEALKAQLGEILFVKSANMGSSIGVNKVRSASELKSALENSFQYDSKVVIEEFVPGREVECAVLGNYPDIKASICGEIQPHHEFYSYEAKYLDENGASLFIPANLKPDTVRRVQELSVAAFKTLNCDGLARVDFFVQADDRVLINEINTLPGFTSISMYPKLWEASGIGYSELITRLLNLAIQRSTAENNLRQNYN